MRTEMPESRQRVLSEIANEDVQSLIKAHRNYGDSCFKRGGVGLFMMLARKWDRLERALDPNVVPGDHREAPLADTTNAPIPAFDILTALRFDKRPEGIIDDVRDLRRYLILVEARAQELAEAKTEPAE